MSFDALGRVTSQWKQMELGRNARPRPAPQGNRSRATLSFAIAVAMLAWGCSGKSERPFLQARICLTGYSDLQTLSAIISRMSTTHGLRFFNWSAELRRQRDELSEKNSYFKKGAFTVNEGALNDDGMGVIVSELGGPGYQVALGFSQGKNPAQAHLFAQSLLGELSKHWRVEPFPGSVGLQPSDNCPMAQSLGTVQSANGH